MVQKSEVRHDLQRYFPSSFVDGRPTVEQGRNSEIVFEDGLQLIKPLKSEQTNPANPACIIPSTNHLFQALKRSAETTLFDEKGFPGVHTYVIGFDKCLRVPISKGVVQGQRDTVTKAQVNNSEAVKVGSSSRGKTTNNNNNTAKKPKKEPVQYNYEPADGIPHTNRRPYLNVNEELPRDMSLALDDREGSQIEVIRCVVKHWLGFKDEKHLNKRRTPNSDGEVKYYPEDYTMKVPLGKRVVIDGHCLTVELGKRLGIKGKQPQNDAEAYFTPIVVGCCLPSLQDNILDVDERRDPKELSLFWAPELYNEIGEAEFGFFYLLNVFNKLYDKYLSVDLLSIDTDVLLLALWYLEKHRGSPCSHIFWRYEPGFYWIFYNSCNPLKEKWVNVNELWYTISMGIFNPNPPPKRNVKESTKKKRDEKLQAMTEIEIRMQAQKHEASQIRFKRSLQSQTFTLVTAFFACGGDYLNGYYGMTPEKMIMALLKYADYIKDLLIFDEEHPHKVTLNPLAYVRFIKAIYLVDRPIISKRFNPSTRLLEERPLHPDEIDPMQIAANRMELSEKNRFPDADIIHWRAQHLTYYIKLVHQVGDNFKLFEMDILKYGYGLIDESKPLHRKNVFRYGESTEEPMFEFIVSDRIQIM